MSNSPELTPDVLRQIVDYDPESGLLTWRHRCASFFKDGGHSAEHNAAAWNAHYAGKPALNAPTSQGYRRGAIFSRSYRAHRVAWAVYYGEWPSDQIDHINHDRLDNRIANLRVVTQAENNRNISLSSRNVSGVTGVCWVARDKRWQAQLSVNGRHKALGHYDQKQDAIAARRAAERQYGFHENHGKHLATARTAEGNEA